MTEPLCLAPERAGDKSEYHAYYSVGDHDVANGCVWGRDMLPSSADFPENRTDETEDNGNRCQPHTPSSSELVIPQGGVNAPMVHKAARNEVLVSSFALSSSSIMTGTVAWPPRPGHSLLDPARNRDILIIAETFRQAAILLAHAYFNVPAGWAFVMDEIALRLAQRSRLARTNVAITVNTTDVSLKAGRLYAFDATATFVSGSTEIAAGRGRVRVMDPRVYARVRGRAGVNSSLNLSNRMRLDGGFALRRVQTDDLRGDWLLDFDPDDPFFFDHPADHVPGMLMLAAIHDAAARTAGPGATCIGLDATFKGFLELDQPTRIQITRGDPKPGTQAGRLCLSGLDLAGKLCVTGVAVVDGSL